MRLRCDRPGVTRMSKINWREWDEKTLEEARRQNKPILLDISATWTRWRRVMDATSYNDDEAAEIINNNFVPIRVDADRRPDVNARYNMGGWPTTAFLTPSGDVIAGGTYFPPDSLKQTLRRVIQAFRRGGALTSGREAVPAGRARAVTLNPGGSLLLDRVVGDVIWTVRSEFDRQYAGFGREAKTPYPDSIELLLNEYHRTQETDLRDMALATLDVMMDSEIHDRAEGGFFRYATKRDWTVPHYEKLLLDQAGAVRSFTQAYQVTTRKEYLQAIRSTLSYVEQTLLDAETGAFYGSQAHDEEYYRLPAKERLAGERPPVDKTVYTDWNAEMSYAYLKAYEAAIADEYLAIAQNNVAFLLSAARRPGSGMYHFYDGQPRAYGMLRDQAQMTWLLCELYQCDGKKETIAAAGELASVMKSEFADSLGGFLDVTIERARDERLAYRDKPLDTNGLAAKALIRLADLTGENEWRRLGAAALRSLAGRYKGYGYLATGYALAVSFAVEEPVEVALIGQPDDERLAVLRRSALRSYEPYKVVVTLDPVRDSLKIAAKGYPITKVPKVLVCIAQTCQPPTGEPEAVEEAVARAGGRVEES